MNSFKITAKHPAFGVVDFTIAADDSKAAFGKWKNMMFSSRQWTVSDNQMVEGVSAVSTQHRIGCNCIDCIDEL